MAEDKKVFCIVNPNLKNLLGHYFEYVHSLMEAVGKKGYEFLVLASTEAEPTVMEKLPAKKAFSREIWHANPLLLLTPFGRKINTLIENIIFYRIIRRTLHESTVNPGWVVFCDSLCHNQMLAWAWWFRALPLERRPRLILLFRYGSVMFDWWSDQKTMAKAFSMLKEADIDGRLSLFSDSSRLAGEYSRFTDIPIRVAPIPHTMHPALNSDGASENVLSRPLRLASLGGARDEKGYLEIIDAINILKERRLLEKFDFVLQTNGAAPELLKATQNLEAANLRNVRFIHDTLSSQDYYELVRSADVILLPYWRSIYAARTSGILTEALAAGKPVIATEDTWMSDQLTAYDTGLTCKDRNPKDIVRAIIEAESRRNEIMSKACNAKERWLKDHNPDALMDALLNPSRSASA